MYNRYESESIAISIMEPYSRVVMRKSEQLVRMSHDGEQLYIEYQRGATWDTR